MGILDNIGKGKKRPGPPAARAQARPSSGSQTGAANNSAPSAARSRGAASAGSGPKGAPPKGGKGKGAVSRIPGRKGKSAAVSQKERVQSAAAPLHDRRRRLVAARESTLRDLGGLMLEMYKRNRFREELLLDKCEEVLAIEVEIAHVDQRLFQLAPPNAAGMRPIGRCECGAPIHPGQNFCGVCGRSFATMTQSRSCTRCGAGLRPGDQFCATCGTEAPDALQTIEAAPPSGVHLAAPSIDAATIATSAVSETVIIDAVPSEPTSLDTPPLDAPPLDPVPAAEAPEPLPEPAGDWRAEQQRAAEAEATPLLDPISDADLASAIERDDASFEPSDGPIILDASAPGDASEGSPSASATDAPTPVEPPAPPSGFDWSGAPESAEPAIDAAIDSMPDPETSFAGLSLTSSVPPPPVVDPVELAPLDVPPIETPKIQKSDEPELGALSRRLGKDSRSFRAARPDKSEKPAKEPKPHKAEKPEKAPKPAKAPKDTGVDDAKARKNADRAAAKALAAEQKQRAKDAKARAKEKAKAARDSRKRGGGA